MREYWRSLACVSAAKAFLFCFFLLALMVLILRDSVRWSDMRLADCAELLGIRLAALAASGINPAQLPITNNLSAKFKFERPRMMPTDAASETIKHEKMSEKG